MNDKIKSELTLAILFFDLIGHSQIEAILQHEMSPFEWVSEVCCDQLPLQVRNKISITRSLIDSRMHFQGTME